MPDPPANAATTISSLTLSPGDARLPPARISLDLVDPESDPVDLEIVYRDPRTGEEIPVLLEADERWAR